MSEGAPQTGSDQTALRPFQVNVPEGSRTRGLRINISDLSRAV
jgi:hypothetical protein